MADCAIENKKKLIKILDHFEALEKLFHLAPIWYLSTDLGLV